MTGHQSKSSNSYTPKWEDREKHIWVCPFVPLFLTQSLTHAHWGKNDQRHVERAKRTFLLSWRDLQFFRGFRLKEDTVNDAVENTCRQTEKEMSIFVRRLTVVSVKCERNLERNYFLYLKYSKTMTNVYVKNNFLNNVICKLNAAPRAFMVAGAVRLINSYHPIRRSTAYYGVSTKSCRWGW